VWDGGQRRGPGTCSAAAAAAAGRTVTVTVAAAGRDRRPAGRRRRSVIGSSSVRRRLARLRRNLLHRAHQPPCSVSDRTAGTYAGRVVGSNT